MTSPGTFDSDNPKTKPDFNGVFMRAVTAQ